jgi:translation initiation factor 1 (eIF-1/SUI1)
MLPRYRDLMRRLVCGQSRRQIEREMNMSSGNYTVIIGSPLFKAELAKMEEELNKQVLDKLSTSKVEDVVDRKLKEASPHAADVNIALLDSTNLGISQKSVFDILDRTGHKPKEHYVAEGSIEITGEVLDDVKKALKDIGEVKK